MILVLSDCSDDDNRTEFSAGKQLLWGTFSIKSWLRKGLNISGERDEKCQKAQL